MLSNPKVKFPESGMDFEFYQNEVLKLDKLTTKATSLKDVDFIVSNKNELLFIEAKTTLPFYHIQNKDLPKECQNIYDKFLCSLLLFLGLHFKRPYSEITATALPHFDLANQKIKFILIIKNDNEYHCNNLNDLLNKAFLSIRKSFKVEDFIVLNETGAKSKGLIL